MDAIKALLESWKQAVLEENLDKIMSHYSDDVVAFDAIMTLQFVGKANYAEHWKKCLNMCPGGIVFEMHDVAIQHADNLAFCHYLTRCGSVEDFGKENASWMRATVCLRLQQDEWKIVHEHFSAPFDPETSKAIFETQRVS